MDKYLRPFEDDLTIYGYNKWPYRHYQGTLSREAEPSLYRQALVSPAVNEPTVALLHGQINERIFKVFGSGGAAVVDAVPAYRALFTEEELPIPADEKEFGAMVRKLLESSEERERRARLGREAVLERHTYQHRAKKILKTLGLAKRIPDLKGTA